MRVRRYLIIATAHIRHATAERLDRWAKSPPALRPLMVASTQTGWFVEAKAPEASSLPLLPPDLAAIQAFGRKQECDHILIDCDGPMEPDLPVFPW